ERSFVLPDGGLDTDDLLDAFVDFWREHAESFLSRQPYSEAAAQLVCMAYFQRIVNGGCRPLGGTEGGLRSIDREYVVGSGRIDLCIRWPMADGTVQRFALELKVWRPGRADPEKAGLGHLNRYLSRLGLDEGTLVIFDQRPSAAPFAERGSRKTRIVDGRKILVLRL
ncbi:MAG: ATP-binding protein, partial [bacterium]|nr:ATP-binding protein [bacterium]